MRREGDEVIFDSEDRRARFEASVTTGDLAFQEQMLRLLSMAMMEKQRAWEYVREQLGESLGPSETLAYSFSERKLQVVNNTPDVINKEERENMKYVADDGAVFESEQACSEYERDLERDRILQGEAARFLDLQPWPEDEKSARRERTKAERWICAWLAHDARQQPDRYQYDESEPAESV